MSEKQLFTKMSEFDDYVLTQQQVDLAEKRLQECKGNLGDDLVIKKLYTWVSYCLAHITFYTHKQNSFVCLCWQSILKMIHKTHYLLYN